MKLNKDIRITQKTRKGIMENDNIFWTKSKSKNNFKNAGGTANTVLKGNLLL